MRIAFGAALVGALIGLFQAAAQADPATYTTSVGGAIPDNNAQGLSSAITVGDNFSLTSFDRITVFGLNHTFLGDLSVTLSHNGTTVDIFDRVIGDGANTQGYGDSSNLLGDYTFVRSGGGDFNAAAAAAGENDVVSPTPTYATFPTAAPGVIGGSSSFDGSLSDFDGQIVGGEWTLNISDRGQGDTGSYTGWSFTVQGAGAGTSASAPQPGTLALALPILTVTGAIVRRRRVA